MEIRKKITEKTKAIIVVQLYGHPAKIDEILEIANDYNLYVIEDCAEAQGAEFKGKKVGTMGHISCFSLYGNKIITTAGGGVIATNEDEIAEKCEIIKNYG